MVGFDAIYNGVAKYILSFHAKLLKKKIRDDFFKVFHVDQANEPLAFLSATKFIIAQASTADEERSLNNALVLGRGLPTTEYCFYLYQLIREHSPNAEDATRQIEDHRLQVRRDVKRAADLREELSWLL